MEFHIVVLCLVSSLFTLTTCYPQPGGRIRLTGQESYNLSDIKEPSQTDYFHPNSVYYDTKATRPSTPEEYFFVSGSNPSSNDEKLGNKEREIGSSQLNTHYTKERSQQEEKQNAPSQQTSNQGKLYDALRELAYTLENIQSQRRYQQQQQTRDGPKPESNVYDVNTERRPSFPPFTPELYPKPQAGPLSILDQLESSAGGLW